MKLVCHFYQLMVNLSVLHFGYFPVNFPGDKAQKWFAIDWKSLWYKILWFKHCKTLEYLAPEMERCLRVGLCIKTRSTPSDTQRMPNSCCPHLVCQLQTLFLLCLIPFFICLQPFNWHQPGMSHSKRKLLQSLMGPYGPLSVSYNGKTCILFKAKRLAIRYRNHTFIDLTERVFNPNSPVDTKGSSCTKEKAT